MQFANATKFSNVYATGAVTGVNAASTGALIGSASGSAGPNYRFEISNAYATGQLTNGGGGLAGGINISGGTVSITNSFYDTGTTGATLAVADGTAGGAGLSTAQMQGSLTNLPVSVPATGAPGGPLSLSQELLPQRRAGGVGLCV